MDRAEVGRRIRELRAARGWALRELGRRAGLAASHLGSVEAGRTSPTLASLLKILEALGTTAPAFFGGPAARRKGVRISASEMPILDDGEKRVRYLLPGEDERFILTHEIYQPHTRHAEREAHPRDLYVYVLKGTLTLALGDGLTHRIRKGEAARLRAGTSHVASNEGDNALEMVVVEVRSGE